MTLTKMKWLNRAKTRSIFVWISALLVLLPAFPVAAHGYIIRSIPEDRAVLEDPAVRGQLIRDIQAQFAHTSAGYAAEHGLYARGWQVPPVAGGRWTIVHSGALGVEPARTPWLDLPSVDFRTLPDAGVLVQFSHADALAEMLAEPA